MPIVQLIGIVRGVSPRQAVDVLGGVPQDRLTAVLDALGPAEIARLLSAASGQFHATLIEALSEARLLDVLRTQSDANATSLLTGLPDARLEAVIATLPDSVVVMLLTTLPEHRQSRLLDAMTPEQRATVLSRQYENAVADALARANMDLSIPAGQPHGTVLAQGLGWRIAVTAGYADDGTAAVHDAESAAVRVGANAALAVTQLRPSDSVVAYCRHARELGRPVDVVMWSGRPHDGQLKRTLASLFQPVP